MENLEQLVQYVLVKKKYQLEKLRHLYSTANEDINSYIRGTKSRGIIGLKFERISNWQHWQFYILFSKRE